MKFAKSTFSRSFWAAVWLLAGSLLACGAPLAQPTQTIVLPTTAITAAEATIPLPTPTSIPDDSGWLTVQPGLEKRQIITNDGRERVQLIRVDPALFAFEIGYTPGVPQTLPDWQTQTGAIALLNGGFFTPEWHATGLIVIDGQASGQSYGERAGMVAIRDGRPEIRWLATQPYDSTESLDDALQSFPMLVQPGGIQGITAELSNDVPDRRSAIGQDTSGRILLIIASRGSFTLHMFSQFLAQSDLDLTAALNLDGGSSSGLVWLEDEALNGIPALSGLPSVIYIVPRS